MVINMIKRELYKLLVNPLFQIMTFVTVFLTIGLCIYFGFNTKKDVIDVNVEEMIKEYYDVEDVKEYYEKELAEISELEVESSKHEQELRVLNYTSKIYEYLLENYIPFDELVDYRVMYNDEINCIYTFHYKVLSPLIYIMFIFIFCILYCVFSQDFDNGSYKYIYTKNNRKHTVFAKLFVVISISLLMSIFIAILATIYATITCPNENLKMISVVYNKAVVFTSSKFLFFNSLSFIFYILFYTLIFSGIFMLSKKTVFAMLFTALYFFAIYKLNDFSSFSFIERFIGVPFSSYFSGDLLYVICYLMTLGIGITACGIIRVCKSNL